MAKAEIQTKTGQVSLQEAKRLEQWLRNHERFFIESRSRYLSPSSRRELHLRYFVSLQSGKVTDMASMRAYLKEVNYALISSVGNNLYPGWHQAFCLWYEGHATMRMHRDHTVYDRGALVLNVAGNATFFLSDSQGKRHPQQYSLSPGSWLFFDNKQPHGIQNLNQDSERLSIVFFKIKPQYLEPPKPTTPAAKQLSLF